MTIPMSTSNYRADFMISDAALPQRVEQAADMQSQFSRVLTEIGGAVEITEVKSAELSEMSELAKFSEMSDLDLARAIVRGEVDIKDVPAERITPKLLMAISVAKRLEKLDEDDEDEKFEDLGEKMKLGVFNTASTAAPEQLMELIDGVESDILEILIKITASEADKTEAVGGISELLKSLNEGLQIGAESELKQPEDAKTSDDFIAAIVDRMVESAAESHEEAPQTVQNAVWEAAPQSTERETVQTVESANVDVFVASEKPVISEETAMVLEKAAKRGEIEKPRAVKPEGESEEQFVVKPATEQAVKPSANAAGSQQLDERAKQLAEELEMLRSAKAARSAKSTAEEDFEIEAPKGEDKLVQTANPLTADSPVVFAREDGSEISVKPSEVVNQTLEAVTKAISEDGKETEYSIVLNPEELGKITVKLTKAADGAVSVTIAAENAHTQRILERNSELMQSNLRSDGIRLESWQTVSESQQEATAQDYNGSSKNPYYREETSREEENDDEKSFAEIIAAM